MTDIGVTGGGSGRHMVYSAGRQDHTMPAEDMIEHIVDLVETKVAAIEADKAQTEAEAAKLLDPAAH